MLHLLRSFRSQSRSSSEMDELNARLAAVQGAAGACAATVDEVRKAAKQSVGDLLAANDRIHHKLAEKDEQLAMAHDHLLHKEEELVRTRAALLEAQDQLAKAPAVKSGVRLAYLTVSLKLEQEHPVEVATRAMRGSGELVCYIRGGAAEDSPLRSNTPMTITQLPSWGDDGQLALGKPKRDAEASQGEASFRPAVCEACNVAMVTKQGMDDHLGGRKHRRAMERLRREQGAP